MTAQDLKNSVLQLAVQGKLVEQNPADEPAAVLLQKIKAEKARLVKEKKIKADKTESVIFKGEDGLFYEDVGGEIKCIDEEIPFEIPESWCWVRLGNLVDYNMGKTPPRKETKYWEKATYNWVSIADLNSNGFVTTTKEKINQYSFDTVFRGNISKAGTLLMSFKLTVGKVSILNIDAFHNEAIISIYPYQDQNKTITNYLFKSLPLFSQTGDTKSAIKGNTLNSGSIDRLLISLPPIEEQQRIVEKINELQPTIEAYDKAERELTILNNRFPDDLKKSVLQYAVQGKLVEQNPEDEPAAVLLEKIKAEKARLLKEKKIKADKVSSSIFKGEDGSYYENSGGEIKCIDEEIPFEIPESWCWVRLGDVATVKGGKRVPKGCQLSEKPTKHIYIRVTDMKDGTIITEKLRYIDEAIFSQIKNYTINKDDLYLTIAGTIGSVGLVPDLFDGMNLTENAVKLTNILINKLFLLKLIQSKSIQDQFIDKTNQVAQPKLAIERILTTLIPLPPFTEQQRIVEKAKELLQLCDRLN